MSGTPPGGGTPAPRGSHSSHRNRRRSSASNNAAAAAAAVNADSVPHAQGLDSATGLLSRASSGGSPAGRGGGGGGVKDSGGGEARSSPLRAVARPSAQQLLSSRPATPQQPDVSPPSTVRSRIGALERVGSSPAAPPARSASPPPPVPAPRAPPLASRAVPPPALVRPAATAAPRSGASDRLPSPLSPPPLPLFPAKPPPLPPVRAVRGSIALSPTALPSPLAPSVADAGAASADAAIALLVRAAAFVAAPVGRACLRALTAAAFAVAICAFAGGAGCEALRRVTASVLSASPMDAAAMASCSTPLVPAPALSSPPPASRGASVVKSPTRRQSASSCWMAVSSSSPG